ncbi:hepatic triacylglycerol lipase [Agrilus planipennis]|uniref:Hepatic triacylglycerol lipase n=1 Tax=Agrilus planipennis TaxID=224129 RepID=A0A1W4XI79_AGRPL|nr:hepatic triacylglycerol lipase [Agrilus planipennis]
MATLPFMKMLLTTVNILANGTMKITTPDMTEELNSAMRSSDELQKNFSNHFAKMPNETTGNVVTTIPESLCTAYKLAYGENEIKISLAPRGYCLHCCQIYVNEHVRFFLYNRQYNGIRLPPQKVGALRQIGINDDTYTVIFIHGFSESWSGPSGRYIVNAYMSLEQPVNVILVDWSEIATLPWYNEAVQNTMVVAKVLAKFLEFYDKTGEIPIRNVHLIGFSLGSHIAGCAAKRLKKGLRISRITGLDPAFPLYSSKSTNRLKRTDADYVDVIHTDAGILGFPYPIGHADFYPNGGTALQPGCRPEFRDFFNSKLADQIVACSHVRAWRLFSESIKNPQAFPATKCQKWLSGEGQCNFTVDAFMGFPYQRSNAPRGRYYLVTNENQPFSRSARQQRSLNMRRKES